MTLTCLLSSAYKLSAEQLAVDQGPQAGAIVPHDLTIIVSNSPPPNGGLRGLPDSLESRGAPKYGDKKSYVRINNPLSLFRINNPLS